MGGLTEGRVKFAAVVVLAVEFITVVLFAGKVVGVVELGITVVVDVVEVEFVVLVLFVLVVLVVVVGAVVLVLVVFVVFVVVVVVVVVLVLFVGRAWNLIKFGTIISS